MTSDPEPEKPQAEEPPLGGPLASTPPRVLPGPVGRGLRHLEHALLIGALLGAAFLPLADTLGRPFGFAVPAGAEYLKQLVLWLAFLGGLVATRERRHLSLSTVELFPEKIRRVGRLLAAAVAAATVAILTYASVVLVLANREEGRVLMGGMPVWILELVMPVSLGLMALRFAWGASARWPGRLIAFSAIPAAFALGLIPDAVAGLALPMAVFFLAALVLGTPVFVAMAAFALFFFFRDGLPVAAVSAEVYRLISSPTLPAIPLLTATGYVLAESNASLRLLRFFKSLLGWMPGGLAVIVIAVCALFTTFTGGSGITVIAIGGLVYPMLREDGYPEGFSLGLVTGAGSLGLLFPPSLAVILYSVVAGTRDHNVPADSLYIAGLIPGLLMIAMVAAYAVRRGIVLRIPRQSFSVKEVLAATWTAKWELAIPVFVVTLFMTGKASLVETAAAAFVFAMFVECFITRDLHVFKTLPVALVKSSVLAGAVLILLSAAMGITSYIVDAQIPGHPRGLGPDPHRVEVGVPPRPQRPAGRGGVPGRHLLGHRGPGSADRAHGRGVRGAPDPPGRHLPGEPGAGLPHAAGGAEPVPGRVALQQAAHVAVPLRAAVPAHHGPVGPADHVRAGPVAGDPEAAGPGLIRRPTGGWTSCIRTRRCWR